VQPGLRVVGVEPEAGDDHRRSKQAGHRVEVPVPRTIADGLQVSVPGELTWEVNARLVDEFVVVSDAEIVRAMAFLFERMKTVVEPSGAVGVAALLEDRVDADGKRVGVILSGSNVGTERFRELMATPR
jgi:threonine dehydratase